LNYGYTKIIKKPEFLRQGLAITLAAQIFTLPILIYNFGYMSLYAPLSNILVEPLVPFITIYGFILALISAISFPLGWLLFFPMWLALTYLIGVTNLFSSLPGATINFSFSFGILVISYFILVLLARYVQQKNRLAFLQ